MMKRMMKRREEFLWESKQELYEYFAEEHGLSREEIDREIERVMEHFRLRSGQAIRTQELWQKVGLDIAERLNDTKALRREEEIVRKLSGESSADGNEVADNTADTMELSGEESRGDEEAASEAGESRPVSAEEGESAAEEDKAGAEDDAEVSFEVNMDKDKEEKPPD